MPIYLEKNLTEYDYKILKKLANYQKNPSMSCHDIFTEYINNISDVLFDIYFNYQDNFYCLIPCEDIYDEINMFKYFCNVHNIYSRINFDSEYFLFFCSSYGHKEFYDYSLELFKEIEEEYYLEEINTINDY